MHNSYANRSDQQQRVSRQIRIPNFQCFIDVSVDWDFTSLFVEYHELYFKA